MPVLAFVLGALLAADAQPAAPARPRTCPAGMVLVEGVHHDQVQRLCTDFRVGKCWSFVPGLVALEGRVTEVSVCMDQHEWPNRAGAEPAVMMSFLEAESQCAAAGKRLCTEAEWETACEGPSRTPFPYGWRQDPEACNSARPYRAVGERLLSSSDPEVRAKETRRLWQGAPSGSHPRCKSAHGVLDLVGNVEEWVVSTRPEWPFRSSLKGGYWSKPWTGCRGTNEAHGPRFRFYEIGFRCCAAPRP